MNLKEVAIDVLAASPCRNALASLESTRIGLRVLNKISYPRSLFDTFPEAWQACKDVTYAGHDHPEYLRHHANLAGRLRASDYAVLYWLSQIQSDPMRILDFGGNVGNLFYSYASYLRSSGRDISWTVFDLPNTVAAGTRLAAEKGDDGLRFTTSLKDIEDEQVILVSSAFHYWEKSVAEFIAQFPTRPRDVIVNRVPVHERQRSFITVQYKKDFAHPCFVRNLDEIISDFDKQGYRLVDRWRAPELRLRMPFFPEHNVPAYSGFYFSSAHAMKAAVDADLREAA